MFYVYEHTRLDTGAIFYVGKGSGSRFNTALGRNVHWHRVVKKAQGFFAKKIVVNVTEELAFLAEIERIDQLKRLNVPLTNISLGGEGATGWVMSEAQRKHKSETTKGVPKGPQTALHRKNLSIARTGLKTGPKSAQARANISKGLTGRIRSAQECAAMSKGKKGLKSSDETKRKQSLCRIGNKNFMYGKTHSESAREKISVARITSPRLTCPYCAKVGDSANMTRWHFNNCKQRKNEMEKKQPQIVTIDGVEFNANDFTEQQSVLLHHTVDLDRKIGSTQFQLQQLQVGKDSFLKLLKEALATPEKVEAEAV